MSRDAYGWSAAAPGSTRYLLPAVIRLLSGIRPSSLLDLGCGNGSLLRQLAGHCPRRVGCDADPGGLAVARQADPSATYLEIPIDADAAALAGAPFDAILSTEVVEHLYRPDDLFRMARRNAGARTRFIVSTPYHGWLKNVLVAAAGGWDRHHTALWNGGHIKFWSPRTLAALAARNGWRQVGFSGAGRLPYLWKSMLLVFQPAPDHGDPDDPTPPNAAAG